jgi:TRAP-type C4-dicarboxylate transport system permease small subunit
MKALENIAAAIFGTAFLILAFAVAVETISRKVFNFSLQGVDELSGYVLAVGGSVACAVALVGRAHIRIDIVHDSFPKILRIVLNVLSVMLLAICAAALARMAWIALDDSILFNSTAQTPWATPLRIPQGAWLAALCLFLAVALIQAVRVVLLILRGRFDEVDRSYSPRGTKDEVKEELEDMEKRGTMAAAGTLPRGKA